MRKFKFIPLKDLFLPTSDLFPFTTLFQRQGVDVSQTDGQSATISDFEMIKVEKSNDTNAENPFGDDDYEEDDDEW